MQPVYISIRFINNTCNYTTNIKLTDRLNRIINVRLVNGKSQHAAQQLATVHGITCLLISILYISIRYVIHDINIYLYTAGIYILFYLSNGQHMPAVMRFVPENKNRF